MFRGKTPGTRPRRSCVAQGILSYKLPRVKGREAHRASGVRRRERYGGRISISAAGEEGSVFPPSIDLLVMDGGKTGSDEAWRRKAVRRRSVHAIPQAPPPGPPHTQPCGAASVSGAPSLAPTSPRALPAKHRKQKRRRGYPATAAYTVRQAPTAQRPPVRQTPGTPPASRLASAPPDRPSRCAPQ